MEINVNTRKEFAKKLEERTKAFAISVLKLSASLPSKEEGRVLKYQLTKSATSIGANYREANRSRSRADFRNKIRICESEASETVYWLEIILKMDWIKAANIDLIYAESKELLALFTAISKKIKT